MNRLTAIILVILLAANVSGIRIAHHFCGKRSQYISFTGHRSKSKCCCSSSGMDKGCCKTKYIKVKLDDKQAVAKCLLFEKFVLLQWLPPVWPEFINANTGVRVYASVIQFANPPPIIPSVRLHVLHHVFLI